VNVAHIPVLGFITHRGDIVNSVESASSAAIADAARAAAADPAVDAILLEVDSPGGEVYGLAEAAAALREVRAVKPVVTHSNTHALSGGYWLLSQGDEIGVTLSGEVGSIGVFGAHEDKSKALEAAGRKVTLVSAGKYKTERNAYGPLSEEAHAAMQSDVDRYYGLFVADVAKGRRVPVDSVRSGYGEGRVVGAKSAVEQGMATFVGTLDEAFKRAASLGAEKRRSMSALAAAQGARAALSME
jgi:signal peptide peptidase SppA